MFQALKEQKFPRPISISTFYTKVAITAIEYGANVINYCTERDIDNQMLLIASQFRVPIILPHSRFFLLFLYFSHFLSEKISNDKAEEPKEAPSTSAQNAGN